MLQHVIKNVTFLHRQAHAPSSSSVTNLSKFGQPYLKTVLNFTTILPFTHYKSPLCDWITSAALLKAVLYVLVIIKLILSHEEKCTVVCVMKTKYFFLRRVCYSGCDCSKHSWPFSIMLNAKPFSKPKNVNETRDFRAWNQSWARNKWNYKCFLSLTHLGSAQRSQPYYYSHSN